MKKITFMLFSMLCFLGTANAQESVTEAIAAGVEIMQTAGQEGSYVVNRGNRLPVVNTYNDRATFGTDCAATLDLEDVAGGPGGIAGCDETISSAAGLCFAAGEIIDDLVVTIGAVGSGQTTVYADVGSGFPNAGPVIGSNTFTDFTVVEFVGNSIGFDLIALTTGASVEVRVNGAGGLLDTFTLDATSGGDVFFGVIADEEIVSIELEDLSGATAELISAIEIGDCTILGVNDNLISQVTVFPNPATDILNIKVPATVEITSATIFDVLGKNTGINVSNGTMNVSGLTSGIYLLTVNTTAGTLTEKIIVR